MKVCRLKNTIISIIIFFVLSVCGCSSKEQQYEMLSFFFTGIPSYEDFANDNQNKKHQVEIEDESEVEITTYFAHPEWAKEKCESCHQTERNEAGIVVKNDLNEPANKLCIKCHVDKTARIAIKERLWLHSPVGEGKCLNCHAAHKSDYPFHLLFPLNNKICTNCHSIASISQKIHDDSKLMNTKTVRKNGCLACHNPHIGANKNLLKAEHNEITDR